MGLTYRADHNRVNRESSRRGRCSVGRLCPPASATGFKVRCSSAGKVTVTDGSFAEAKEVIGGYALMKAASKEEILELTRKFLSVAGQGTCEKK